MDDLIDRQAAIVTAIRAAIDWHKLANPQYSIAYCIGEAIRQLPSAEPEVRPIDYRDCSNAMMKMWIDGVLTDGEYSRIMDKLNAHWRKKND